jgi:hypothetical protein
VLNVTARGDSLKASPRPAYAMVDRSTGPRAFAAATSAGGRSDRPVKQLRGCRRKPFSFWPTLYRMADVA